MSDIKTHDVGDPVGVSVTLRDANGVLVDPATVTLRVKAPGGAVTAYTGGQVTHDSTGVYHVNVIPDRPGMWQYRYVATGPALEEPGRFYVRPVNT